NTKVAEMGRAYLFQRQRFGEEAEALGLDPLRVVGQHDSLPFRDRYYEAMDAAGIAVRRPITPEQETAVKQLWKAQRGNPDLTPETVARWYLENNIPPPSLNDTQKAIAEARGGANFGGLDPERQPAPDARVSGNDPWWMQFAAGVGDIAQGAGDIVGL